VLLPFDRSEDSGAAIGRIATLAPDAEVTVLTVWAPGGGEARPPSADPVHAVPRPAGPAGLATSRTTAADDDAREDAVARAAVGARHAAAAGLRARRRSQPAPAGAVAAIVAVADEIGADLVVMGRHGRSGRRYRELGETVRGVLEHTGRPVLVVSGHDVPHADVGAAAGHGGVHVGAWVPRTPEDEQDGTA
jgi:nucleotide-binding universal stress UspA family protein